MPTDPPPRTCFIAMPITTPEDLAATAYGGDQAHFRHVLDCLFIPAIEAAGLEPIPPIAQGSEVIHGDIIKHLETSDLVLCDMSTLNANVFLELGIRTALDKPVCLVRDDKTPDVPFDAAITNHFVYDSILKAWELHGKVTALTKHISETLDRSGGRNAIWRYFGITSRAQPPGTGIGKDDVLNSVVEQVAALRDEVRITLQSFVARDFDPEEARGRRAFGRTRR